MAAAELDRVFVNDVFVGLGLSGRIVHVPAKRFKERIDEFLAELGLFVAGGVIGFAVQLKLFDELRDLGRTGHGKFEFVSQGTSERGPANSNMLARR